MLPLHLFYTTQYKTDFYVLHCLTDFWWLGLFLSWKSMKRINFKSHCNIEWKLRVIIQVPMYSMSYINNHDCRKWYLIREVQIWTRLLAFHLIIKPLRKIWILHYSVNNRAVWLASLFNGISTFVGYLMLKPFS